MIIRPAVAVVCLLAATAASSGPLEGAEARPLLQNGQIRELLIDENGAWTDRISGHETSEMCRSFLLTEADVRQFVGRARAVSEQAYAHDLPAAMCYGEGRLALQDGTIVRWHIDQTRRGFIAHPDGRTQYLYCRRCSTAVFAPR